MKSTSVSSKVGVYVRCRPLNSRELQGRRCLSIKNDTVFVGDKKFAFEHIFDENAAQLDIYEACVKSLVDGCFKGFNATVFAYGQTGSGKTHSIMGTATEDEGIIPRAINDVFRTIKSDKDGKMASVRVSMIEIYNDDCRDLLHPDILPRDIMIREDKDGRIFFTGAREEAVSDARTAMFYLEQGNLNRSTAETLMNSTSSRSHAIFTISIEILDYSAVNIPSSGGDGDNSTSDAIAIEGSSETAIQQQQQQAMGSYLQAKLHLVDLAGSERAKRTGALGVRLKESVGINQGLLSLGKVIRALTTTVATNYNSTTGNTAATTSTHVPYRESKLTRFLQDSLGGNSRTVMLACISSAECNIHETLGTLQYAVRAKSVQNKLSANKISVAANMGELHHTDIESSVVLALRSQIDRMKEEMVHYMQQQQQQQQQQSLSGLPPPPAFTSPSAPYHHTDNVVLQQQRIFSVLSRIHDTLLEHMQHLVQEEVCTPEACGAAWNLVCVCSTVMQTIKELLQQELLQQQQHYSGDTRSGDDRDKVMRRSISNPLRTSLLNTSINELRGGGALVALDREEEIQALQLELEECKEDLKRDEDIFAEKVKELKRCRKALKDVETENATLVEKQLIMQQQLQKLASTLMNHQRSAPNSSTKLKDNNNQRLAALSEADSKRKHQQHQQQHKTSGRNSCSDDEVEHQVDDLDISVAVAVTEPDISQLMEDIEVMALEREQLIAAAAAASSTTAAAEKKKQLQSHSEYKEEQNDKNKKFIEDQRCRIVELTASQLAAEESSEQYRKRCAELEQISSRLHEQIHTIEASLQESKHNHENEQLLRVRCEDKLLLAEQQIQKLIIEQRRYLDKQAEQMLATAAVEEEKEEDRKARYDQLLRKQEQSIIAEHQLEVEGYRCENHRLQQQLEQSEGKQRKTLDQLSHQVTQYKKKLTESQQQMKVLEDKNADLRARLDRMVKLRNKTGGQQPQSTGNDETADIATGAAAVNEKEGGGASQQQQQQHSNSHSHMDCTNKEQVVSWLKKRIGYIVDIRLVRSELQRLQKICSKLTTDKENILSELVDIKPPLPPQQQQQANSKNEAAEKFRVKVMEIRSKIDALRAKSINIEARIQQQQQQQRQQSSQRVYGDTTPSSSPTLLTVLQNDWDDIQYTISSYEDHEREYLTRIHNITSAGSDDKTEQKEDVATENYSNKSLQSENNFIQQQQQSEELKEELETIEAELSLNLTRVAQERVKLSKLLNQHNRDNNNKDSKSIGNNKDWFNNDDDGVNEEQHLYQDMVHEVKAFISSSSNSNNNNINNNRVTNNNSAGVSVKRQDDVILESLVSLLVDGWSDSHSHSTAIQQMQQQLTDKSAEYDELVRAMHRSRSDALRRQEQQKSEAEDKIAFLLQQLRSSEASRRTVATGLGNNIINSMNSSAASGESNRRPPILSSTSIDSEFPTNHGDGNSRRNSPPHTNNHDKTRRNNNTNNGQHRTHTSIFSFGNQTNDPAATAAFIRSSINAATSINTNPDITTVNVHTQQQQQQQQEEQLSRKEVQRRWAAEKQRRERMESSNAEMIKELRQLKQLSLSTSVENIKTKI